MNSSTKKTLLVVGAGGFIGGFIAKEGLAHGYDTYAGVRPSTSLRRLGDPRLHIVNFDYDNPEMLAKAIAENAPDDGSGKRRWQYIIWNLGATKCANWHDFDRINHRFLLNFTKALHCADAIPDRLLYVSSLSALGPGDEKNYTPLNAHTIPNPNTRYGLSKIKAEMCLEAQPDIPWTIFRPTGVYGPYEKDYLMMIKSIDRHCDVSMGMRKQMLTFVYVDDLVNAMFLCLNAPANVVLHKKYIISEDRAYTQAEFRKIVADELGRKFVIPIKLPMWTVYVVSAIAEKIAAAQAKASTLNRDKYRIMRQRNWTCSIDDAKRDFGFSPQWSLQRGIRETVKEYLRTKKS